MKYLTDDLLARSKSTDDDILDAVSREWEQALQEYETHLQRIREHLPIRVRDLLDKFCLHDAKILTFSLTKSRRDDVWYWSIFLRPEGSQEEWYELKYQLVNGPGSVRIHRSAPGKDKPFRIWLYDEFDVLATEPHATFLHSVLFSGGFELQIHFKHLKIRRHGKMYFPSEPLGRSDDDRDERQLMDLLQTA
jgi:hypothetical protein